MACQEECVYASINKDLYETQPAADALWDKIRPQCDVTFQLPDGELKAHRWILSKRLKYFRAMFASGMKEARTGIVVISDFDRAAYDDFLRFLYCGESPRRLEEPDRNETMAEIALRYEVPELYQLCAEALVRVVDRQKTVARWLAKAKEVHHVLAKRFELAVPKSWICKAKEEFCRRLAVKLRQQLYSITILPVDISALNMEPRHNEFSGLSTATTAVEDTDRILASVLIACDEDAWVKDALLFTAYVWTCWLKLPDFPAFSMTEALREVKERIGLFLAFHAFYVVRKSDEEAYYYRENEEILIDRGTY